jgi:hypothetical protein
VFYSVIETRDFSLFNQSAQALLKGYFINAYSYIVTKHKNFKNIKTLISSQTNRYVLYGTTLGRHHQLLAIL